MTPNPQETVDGLLAFRQLGCSKFQNATGENAVMTFSDTTTLDVHSGNDKSHLAPDSERYISPSVPSQPVGHSIQWFCAIISIFDI
jgi:hypothetical protein